MHQIWQEGTGERTPGDMLLASMWRSGTFCATDISKVFIQWDENGKNREPAGLLSFLGKEMLWLQSVRAGVFVFLFLFGVKTEKTTLN